jgi:methionine-rich copper-binding protein CopC
MIGTARRYAVVAAAALQGLLGGCAQNSDGASSPSTSAERSVLASSNPAAGSTVAAPVNELALNFDPPARLVEVTVTGPDGMMPTMITSVGEVSRYSVPLPDLGPGNYTVRWNATVGGEAHEGTFGFTIR